MMENKELFLSIIIPIYNGADHLASTLESVLNSGIDAFSSEVLLVNDGSTDETLSICKRYLVEYPQLFRLFSKKNGGISSARNYGLSKARGQYVFFLDDDDLLRPDSLKLFYDNYFDNLYDVIGFSCDTVDFTVDLIVEKGTLGSVVFEGCGIDFMKLRTPTFVWVYWYKRSFLVGNNIEFRIHYPEDVLFNLSVFRLNPIIRITNQKVICYMNYREEGQLTKVRDPKKLIPILEGYMCYFRELSNSKDSHGLSETSINMAINGQIIPFVSRCLSSSISREQFKVFGLKLSELNLIDFNPSSLYSRVAFFIIRNPFFFPFFKFCYRFLFQKYVLPNLSRS